MRQSQFTLDLNRRSLGWVTEHWPMQESLQSKESGRAGVWDFLQSAIGELPSVLCTTV